MLTGDVINVDGGGDVNIVSWLGGASLTSTLGVGGMEDDVGGVVASVSWVPSEATASVASVAAGSVAPVVASGISDLSGQQRIWASCTVPQPVLSGDSDIAKSLAVAHVNPSAVGSARSGATENPLGQNSHTSNASNPTGSSLPPRN